MQSKKSRVFVLFSSFHIAAQSVDACWEDAAKIGFDDDFIYKEIELKPEMRSLPSEILMQEKAMEAFKMWAEKEDKAEY